LWPNSGLRATHALTIYDCQTCGACCCNRQENRLEHFHDYVQVFAEDALQAHPKLLVRLARQNKERQWHLKLKPDGSCVALDGEVGQSVGCTIYELRPQVCKNVQPGDSECLTARRERGLSVEPTG